MKSKSIKRMWINQPSTSQPYHKLHGTRVLALVVDSTGEIDMVYFLDGATVSAQVPHQSLSSGWPDVTPRFSIGAYLPQDESQPVLVPLLDGLTIGHVVRRCEVGYNKLLNATKGGAPVPLVWLYGQEPQPLE